MTDREKSSALITRPDSEVAEWAPAPLALLSDDEFKRRVELAQLERGRIEEIQRSIMRRDIDFGLIPGTKHPTLLKPGAEILNKLAGYTARFIPERHEGDGESAPDIRFQTVCELMDRNGEVVAQGHGSANSWETKHRYRGGARLCPECGVAAIIKGSEKYGGGWVCWKRKDGCGAKFEDNEPRIMGQSGEKIENPDPLELDNTLLKMAEKRAYVDATLRAHAASGIFAQDADDEPPGKLERTRATKPVKVGKASGSRPPAPDPEASTGGAEEGGTPESEGDLPPLYDDELRDPASEPDRPKIPKGRLTLLQAKAKARAKTLGLDDADAGSTLLSEVLRAHGISAPDDVRDDEFNQILASVNGATV